VTQLYWLDPSDESGPFPDVELAREEPNGLLAVGGDLSPGRLLHAYRLGIFPWYSDHQPILWWSPDPRAVLFPADLKVSRSLRKVLRRGLFTVTADRAFDEVIRSCSEPRPGQDGTWITGEMASAYRQLHHLGHAHSVEAWQEGELVGGLYGIALGKVFFGESMFTRVSNASKVAFVHLVRQLDRWGYHLIDCQIHTDHLASLGSVLIPRREFSGLLRQHCDPIRPGLWQFDADLPDRVAQEERKHEPQHG
jgi:leucyl/phenylalanyl-tRNA--protein transferase